MIFHGGPVDSDALWTSLIYFAWITFVGLPVIGKSHWVPKLPPRVVGKTGPQDKPFVAAEKALGKLPIWAEDLGDIDQPVHDLRERLGFPTMRVLQFGYAQPGDDFHRHTSLPEQCIVYTGTHDNETLMGWFHSRQPGDHGHEDVLAGFLDGEQEINIQIIKLAYQSAAVVAIIPMQDFLALGAEARMNVPGQAVGNWHWRIDDSLTPELADRIEKIVSESGRLSPMIRQQ